jgi:hypothetical protein
MCLRKRLLLHPYGGLRNLPDTATLPLARLTMRFNATVELGSEIIEATVQARHDRICPLTTPAPSASAIYEARV